ncbi:MAG TPA: hypothetical protein VG347_10525 [Verrucomicrobiae bacterium]|nr:hypothetical protein [Verrucomicrobiae bacterium]
MNLRKLSQIKPAMIYDAGFVIGGRVAPTQNFASLVLRMFGQTGRFASPEWRVIRRLSAVREHWLQARVPRLNPTKSNQMSGGKDRKFEI